MNRFIRTVTISSATQVPAAMSFAKELHGYLSKAHALNNMKVGVELFGALNVHWHADFEKLDDISGLMMRLMQDKTYLAMLEKAKDFLLAGSLKDTVIALPD